MHKQERRIMTALAIGGLSLTLLTGGCGSKEEPSDTAGAKPYPLKTCLVSDEALGSMGEPVSIVHEGQEIKFCCKSCIDDFKGDPAKYLAKLSQAPVPEKAEP